MIRNPYLKHKRMGGTKRARISKTKTKPTIETEEHKIALMKAELHYFKGLSIFFTIMMVCLFVAFGSLFGAMYYETRLMRMSLERVLGDALPKIVVASNVAESVVDNSDLSGDKLVGAREDWLSFEKYSVKVFFPNSWTFLDKPNLGQIHFYSDGVIREIGSTAIGDFIVALTKTDNYANKGKREVALVGDKLGYVYAEDNGISAFEAIVVKVKTGYVELKFNLKSDSKEVVSMDQEKAIREQFKFLEE